MIFNFNDKNINEHVNEAITNMNSLVLTIVLSQLIYYPRKRLNTQKRLSQAMEQMSYLVDMSGIEGLNTLINYHITY